MYHLKNAYAALCVLLLIPATALAELPSLLVRVVNVSPVTGTLEVSLFDTAESFMKQPFLQQSGPAVENGTFETRFADMIEGEYAIVVVHDANDNKKLDTGFLGFGRESYGYSNNVSPWFGWPDFEDAVIEVSGAETVIEIDLD